MSNAAEMNALLVDDNPPKKSPIHWRWLITDVLFGVVAPILSLIFDPVVFRGNAGLGFGSPLLAQNRVFTGNLT